MWVDGLMVRDRFGIAICKIMLISVSPPLLYIYEKQDSNIPRCSRKKLQGSRTQPLELADSSLDTEQRVREECEQHGVAAAANRCLV